MENYVKGKSIIMTGGSSGFGLEAARMLLEMGARVTITGRNAERLATAERDLGHEDVLPVQADAVDAAQWQSLIEAVTERFGRIDVLVNNHGAGVKIAEVEQMDDATIQEVMDINLMSVIRGCREVLPVMRKQGSGQVINVASACAHRSWPYWSVYSAAKAGLVSFTRCLHKEMALWGGKATSFVPGAAQTAFCDAANIDDSWLDGYPTAADFARTLVHCVDMPDSSFIEEAIIWGTLQVRDAINPF